MTDDQAPAGRSAPTGTARRLILLAAGVVSCEALLFVVLAVLNLRDIDSGRLVSGLGVAVVLAGYAAAHLLAIRLLLQGHAAARSPVIVTQILQGLVATNLTDAPALALAVGLPAAMVLVCLLSPPVSRALASDPR
ncbi:MAG: hypothetical protein WB508_10985 [Aeromicrobium sp.]|uniref:hypothetical protein n=1 Tax=Aeromicrobium sp. TaxID=1871063 RepID=UPI003C612ADC